MYVYMYIVGRTCVNDHAKKTIVQNNNYCLVAHVDNKYVIAYYESYKDTYVS